LAIRTGGCELEHRVAVRFGGESLDRGVPFGELAPDPAPARARRGPGSVTAGESGVRYKGPRPPGPVALAGHYRRGHGRGMRPRFRPNRVALAGYAGFIALSAFFGSVGMISGLLPVGGSLAERLPWHSPAFAGIALALVGLPASVVAVLSWRRHPRTADAAALAGLLLVFVHLHESSLRDPRIPLGVFGVYSWKSRRGRGPGSQRVIRQRA
jgi:hypothetical protein